MNFDGTEFKLIRKGYTPPPEEYDKIPTLSSVDIIDILFCLDESIENTDGEMCEKELNDLKRIYNKLLLFYIDGAAEGAYDIEGKSGYDTIK